MSAQGSRLSEPDAGSLLADAVIAARAVLARPLSGPDDTRGRMKTALDYLRAGLDGSMTPLTPDMRRVAEDAAVVPPLPPVTEEAHEIARGLEDAIRADQTRLVVGRLRERALQGERDLVGTVAADFVEREFRGA